MHLSSINNIYINVLVKYLHKCRHFTHKIECETPGVETSGGETIDTITTAQNIKLF